MGERSCEKSRFNAAQETMGSFIVVSQASLRLHVSLQVLLGRNFNAPKCGWAWSYAKDALGVAGLDRNRGRATDIRLFAWPWVLLSRGDVKGPPSQLSYARIAVFHPALPWPSH